MTISPLKLPAWASRLRAPLPQPYLYRSRLKRRIAASVDAWGERWIAQRPPQPIVWSSVKRVAVLRLDHLGDLLNSLPALRRLRRALPKATIDLWVGPWGRDLAGLFTDVDAVHVASSAWFERPQRQAWPLGQIFGLGRALKAGHYDVGIDLRGDLRHHWALWQAGIPQRVGLALSAGKFLLSHPGQWQADLHEQDQALSLLDQCGLPARAQGPRPYLRRDSGAEREAAALAKRLGLGDQVLLIQAACGTQAKRWPTEHWASLLRALPKTWQPVLLGSSAEVAEMQALAKQSGGRAQVAAGALSLPGLAAFLRRGRLLLSVDSGPAHLAALQGLAVLSLYSATNRASQWAPQGERVTLLRAPTPPCSPCELAFCPFNNACMRAIRPQAALAALKTAWKRTYV